MTDVWFPEKVGHMSFVKVTVSRAGAGQKRPRSHQLSNSFDMNRGVEASD